MRSTTPVRVTINETEEYENIEYMVKVCQKWLNNTKRSDPPGKYVQVNFVMFDTQS